jgi:hypothetical protein
MVNKREKGKIAHSEWPNILARYSKGETIAQIGRDYGCTAPAIRYIIKRNGMLKDESGGARVGAASGQTRASGLAAVEGREPGAWTHATNAPLIAASPKLPAGNTVLEPELRQRVSGDVASFLVALDHVVLEGSLESAAGLQEATDRLMRSVARTRLELERVLSRHEMPRGREKPRKKAGLPQRSA